MSRSRGRRTAARQRRGPATAPTRRFEPTLTQSRIPVWLWPLLVLITVAGLVVAGTGSRPAGTRVEQPTVPKLIERSVVCAGGLPGATANTANVAAMPITTQPIGEQPIVITEQVSANGTPVASQSASDARMFGYAACPEPRADWWIVGAGGSDTHPSTVTLDNPRTGVAVVDLHVFGDKGRIDAPGLRGITIAPGARRTFDLRRVAPSASDVAVHVIAQRGLVSAIASDQWSSTMIGQPVAEWVPAQPSTTKDLVLTGLPLQVAAATLVVANPNPTETIVKVQAIGVGSTFAPEGATSLTVPAESVASLNVAAAFDGKPVAVRLSSEQKITATIRAVVQQDETYAGVGEPLRGVSALSLPEGATGRVILSSTGAGAEVSMQSYDGGGKPIGDPVATKVASNVSVGVDLPAGTRAVQLKSSGEGVVAGLSLTQGAGIGGAAFPVAADVSRTPAVGAAW